MLGQLISNLSEVVAIAIIALAIHTISFPIGVFLCNAFKSENAKQCHAYFFVTTGLGMMILLPLVFIASFFSLSLVVVLALSVSLVASVSSLRLGRLRSIRSARSINVRKRDIFVIALYLLSLVIFSRVGNGICVGPSPGDIVWHLNIVSVIRYQGKMPENMLPLSNATTVRFGFSPQGYPLGLGVFAATVAAVFGTNSILALVAVVVSIVSVIPLVLFEISFEYSNSLPIATMTFIFSFFSPSGIVPHYLRDFILSFMITGLFPNLAGILLFVLLLAVVLQSQESGIVRYFLLLTPIFATTVIVYPLFLPLLGTIAMIEVARRVFCKAKLGLAAEISTIVSSVLVVAQLATFAGNLANPAFPWSPQDHFLPTLDFRAFVANVILGYIASPRVITEFLTTLPGILVPIGIFLFSVLLTTQDVSLKNHDMIALISVSCFLVISISVSSWFPAAFWWTISDRTYPLLLGLAYVVAPVCVSRLLRASRLKDVRLVVHSFSRSASLKSISALIIALTMVGFVLPHLIDNYQYDGFGSADDRVVSKWIAGNIGPTELILNDRSFAGLLIFSWRAFNAVNTYLTWETNVMNRAFELNYILDRPFDYDSFRGLSAKWNLSYIWITTQESYWSWERELLQNDPLGLGGRLRYRPYEQEAYLSYFDNNPWLSRVFSSGNSVVYKVHLK